MSRGPLVTSEVINAWLDAAANELAEGDPRTAELADNPHFKLGVLISTLSELLNNPKARRALALEVAGIKPRPHRAPRGASATECDKIAS